MSVGSDFFYREGLGFVVVHARVYFFVCACVWPPKALKRVDFLPSLQDSILAKKKEDLRGILTCVSYVFY